MLFSKHIVSTRTLLQLAVALFCLAGGMRVASAATNPPPAPLLVPYTINVVAGNPNLTPPGATVPVGYAGEGSFAAPSIAHPTPATTLNAPYSMAVDSVGNIYITDKGNDIIREVNAQTGLITTVAGIPPKACSGITCSVRTTGCADGVPAFGNGIGSSVQGIAVDNYGNIYFVDNVTATVSVIYRGGSQVAAFIGLVDPGGVAKSGGAVQSGYVYHVAGTINLTTCAATTGNADNVLAFEDSANPPAVAGGQLKGPTMLSLDSAGNIYINDVSNLTVRVINTQATDQTFFQYVVHPGYMRSITNCSAALTVPCPTAVTTATANTGFNGPVNALVMNSQFKFSTVDAYGNVYEGNGTGGGTGPPGIYGAVAYAGGTPLTNVLTAEAPMLSPYYSAAIGNAPDELPLTYGRAYVILGNPAISSALPSLFPDVYPPQNQSFDIRPASLRVDTFGTLWFLDTHYPELNRIDQYTSLATLTMWWKGRVFGTVTGLYGNNPATVTNPYYCVYGNSNPGQTWTQGPKAIDPEGDGCPAAVAFMGGSTTSGPDTTSDGLGNIYYSDSPNDIIRELPLGNAFPTTPMGTSVTQAIQVHFNSANAPVITGVGVPAAQDTNTTTTTSFQTAAGISDFTINTTDPQFPLGSLISASYGAAAYTPITQNFSMYAGLPSCTQLGVFPSPVSPTDSSWDCLVYVTFKPTAPGIRQSQLIATTTSGLKYSFSLSGVGSGGQLAIDGGTPTAVTATGLGKTAGIAVAQSGTVYIADPDNNRIVVEPAGSGTQTTIGTGLSGPKGVAVDAAGNVYISDTGNNRVLKVNPLDGTQTVLGNNVWISCPIGTTAGTVCPSTVPQYQFKAPQGLAVDAWNNVYVADTGNSAVVEIPSNITLGGAAPLLAYPNAPKFVNPVAVTVDSLGNIYVADTQEATAQIVELPPGGGDLVTVPNSQFPTVKGFNISTPNGVVVDAAGNVYVSDSGSNKVTVFPAGTGNTAIPYSLNLANLSAPAGLALDAGGNLYVADSGNKQVLFLNRQNPVVDYGTVPQFQNNPATTLTVMNIGSQPVTLISPITSVISVNPAGNTAFTVTNNTCAAGPLSQGVPCTIAAAFAPTTNGPQGQNLSVNGGSQTISLTANGEQPLVNVTLAASYSVGSTPTVGATATITATVTAPHVAGHIPTGSVVFNWAIDANAPTYSCGSAGTPGGTTSGAATVTTVNGVASFALPTLAQGLNYTIKATFNPDASNTQDTGASATPLVVQVPGITSTVVATPVSFTYGKPVPAITGTVTPAPASPTTFTFTSAASVTTPIGTYPIQVLFSGGNYCAYGFPPAVTSTGAPAVVTENPAPLKYTTPNITSQYGALPVSYGANAVITGAVNGDKFAATFTPPDSSVLNVGTYVLTPTVTGAQVGNYAVTAPPATLTITSAPSGITIGAAQTAVLNTAAGVATATYQIVVGTLVTPQGKGVPTGTIAITDNFVPISSTVFGVVQPPCSSTITTNCYPATPACSATVTTNCNPIIPPCSATVTTNCNPILTLVAGFTTYTPTSTLTGTHHYSFAYSGDSNFQCSVVGQPAVGSCPSTGTTTSDLLVDNPDFNVSSTTGVINILPGVVPSGNGLPVVAGQNTAAPETAIISISTYLGFTGQVSLACTTQHPSYVSCSMTPPVVCFATTSSPACTNTATSTASVLSVWTPATLPLGFSTAQVRMSTTKTVLAFLPFGILAFCVRRRRRLSKALWMLIMIVAVGAGMSGCGGNQVDFYTPIPTGPQTVLITGTFPGTGSTRTFTVPININ